MEERCTANVQAIFSVAELKPKTSLLHESVAYLYDAVVVVPNRVIVLHYESFQVLDDAALQVPRAGRLHSRIDETLKFLVEDAFCSTKTSRPAIVWKKSSCGLMPVRNR